MTLEELRARAHIHDALPHYCRGSDREDINPVRWAFHKDAWIQFLEDLRIDPADTFFDFLTNEMPRLVPTQCFLESSPIEFDGPEVHTSRRVDTQIIRALTLITER